MKKLIPILFPIALFAQTGNTVEVSQSAEIAQLMNLYRAYNKKNDLADGYRLQIMFSNDRNEAYNAKSKLYKQFPRESCYVIYEQPYYKLRVGDYINRFEATDMLNQMLSTYTGAFIVKDKVKIK
jgi:hypothetical protein